MRADIAIQNRAEFVVDFVYMVSRFLSILFFSSLLHSIAPLASEPNVEIEEELERRLPPINNRYDVPKQMLEDLRNFFIRRDSLSSLKLAHQVLRATYSEMILESMKAIDDELFNFLMQYSSPKSLNVQLDGHAGETLLTYICSDKASFRRVKYLSALVDGGADLTFAAEDGTTPFLSAVQSGNTIAIDFIIQRFLNSPETSQLLIPYVSARSGNGISPIYAAAIRGQARTVHLLLDLGVDPNSKSPDGTEVLLTTAVHTGSIDLIRHLLSAGADVRGLNKDGLDAMSVALKYYRHQARIEILAELRGSSLQEIMALPTHERRRRSPSDAILRIHSALKTGLSSDIVLELLELEIDVENKDICTTRDADGRNLFHSAIRFRYPKVALRLMEFYSDFHQRSPLESQLCCADVADRFGFYPSETIIQREDWSSQPELYQILNFLYAIHPVIRTNSLREILRNPPRISYVFMNAMIVERRFGAAVLRVTESDLHDEDLLLSALNNDADDTVIALILEWLMRLSSTNIKAQKLLSRNIFMAAGGPVQRLNRYRGGTPQRRALALASKSSPVFIYHLLTTIFIGTPLDEVAYRELLFHFKASFPPFPYSPLSHVIRCQLHPMNEILSADLALELITPHNHFKFIPTHFLVALEFLGNSPSLPYLHSQKQFPLIESSIVGPRFDNRLMTYPWIGLLLPIFGSHHFVITSELLDHPVNPAALTYRRRKASIAAALLTSSMTPIHNNIAWVSQMIFFSSCMILSVVLIGLTYPFTVENVPNELRSLHAGWIPMGRQSWQSSISTGLRTMLDVPRFQGRIRPFRDTPWSLVAHSVYFAILFIRFSCSLYYFFEIWFVVPRFLRVSKVVGIDQTIARPLWIIPTANFVIYTAMARFSSPAQTRWLRWMIFGLDSDTIESPDDEGRYRELLDNLEWRPRNERLNILYSRKERPVKSVRPHPERSKQTAEEYTRKHVRSILANESKREQWWARLLFGHIRELMSGGRTTRKSAQNKKSKSTKKTSSAWSRIEKPVARGKRNERKESTTTSVEEVEPVERVRIGPIGKPLVDSEKIDPLRTIEKRWELEKALEYEEEAFNDCVGEFGIKAGHARDVVISTILCFSIVQMPFWRCFNKLKIFNYEIYSWVNKYHSYMVHPWITYFRELAVFIACWVQLCNFFIPLIVALRFAAVFQRISIVLLKGFPLEEYTLVKKATHQSSNDQSPPPIDFFLEHLQAYLDIRQTIFKQLESAYSPIQQSLYLFMLCAAFRIIWFTIEFQLASDPRSILIESAFRFAGLQSLVFLVMIIWLICSAARANSFANAGFNVILQIQKEEEGRPDTPYQKLISQTLEFFEIVEFRISLIGVHVTPAIAAFIIMCSIACIYNAISKASKSF